MQILKTREEFLRLLDSRLMGLPAAERQRVMDYYNEIILDGVENGKAEEDVIRGLGDVDEIAVRTIPEYAPDAAQKRSGTTAGKVVLWVCAAPFLICLGIPLAAVALVLYVCVWVILACFFIVAGSLGLVGVVAMAGAAVILFKNPLAALLQVGAALFCLGLCLLAFVGSLALSKQFVRFSAYMFGSLSARIRKRGVNHEA